MAPHRNAHTRNRRGYICVHDPSEGAPYKGGHLSQFEFRQLLDYAYLPPASLWSLQGRIYRVIGAVSEAEWPAEMPQRLELVKEHRNG